MKKIIAAVVVLGASVAYLLLRPATPTPQAVVSGTEKAPIIPRETTPAVAAGMYKDGVYVGDAVDAFYGIVQVQATIAKSRITNVTFLKYPNDRENTIRISNLAMPQLVSEAIKVQSAQVDMISGATQTVEGFQQSLSSALAKAII